MFYSILKWPFFLIGVLGFSSVGCSVENYAKAPFNNINVEHIIHVSALYGHDTSKCLKSGGIPCQTLRYVFENIKGQNSTAIYVEPGHYVLNESFTFWNVNYFAVIGSVDSYVYGHDTRYDGKIGKVVIQCLTNVGLAFINSSEIILKNVILSQCGAIQNSTSITLNNETKATEHQKFLVGLFLVNCLNLSMDSVEISESPEIGMQLYDVAGIVNISNSIFSNNGKRNLDNLDNPGGGFYFEFTFMGGLYPFKAPPEQIYKENGIFYFINVFFYANSAPKLARNVDPGGNQHDAFGRGGGASFFIKGSANKNSFVFEKCFFHQNSAKWGAGLFVEFQDSTKTNNMEFHSCKFVQNTAAMAGGGMRIGLITVHDDITCRPNWIRFRFCRFEHNNATIGGGMSLYGNTKVSYSIFPDGSFVNLTNCVFVSNLASLGSAFLSSLLSTNQYGIGNGDTYKIYIKNSHIENNRIIYTEDGLKVCGSGTMYAQGTPFLLENTTFIYNTKTALVLDNAYVRVFGNVLFKGNSGEKGGAMSLYGLSKVVIAYKTNLSFIENNCSSQGGAIYVRTPGPQMVAFNSTELKIHPCFFYFEDPENSDVSFYGNKGPNNASGHSVYATTLKYCRATDEPRVNNKVLEGKSFHYYYANGTKSNMVYEIVTDAVNMEVHPGDWNISTDTIFSPFVNLTDEKSNSVTGIIKITLLDSNEPIKFSPSPSYFFVKDKIQSLQVFAKPKTHYNISLETVDSQQVVASVSNAVIKNCAPGFYWEESSCKCDKYIGVSRCDYDKKMLFLLSGYWGGYISSKFIVVQCPENYCYCNHSNFSSSGECLYLNHHKCKGNREGQLCGQCKKGHVLKVGEDDCTPNCLSKPKKWIGYVIGIVLFLTLFVLIVMLINFDPFTAYLNAWLYFYQVLSYLVPSNITFDPFLTFVIGLAQIQVVEIGGVCLWVHVDDLQKFLFNYILPLYFFICLYILNKVFVRWPNNLFTRRFTQVSLARAFCTLFVLSYSTVVIISVKILYPIQIGNHYFVYYQGSIEYFSSYHAPFAVVAIILVIFVGILFPLLLVRRSLFNCIDKGLLKLLLDNFQRCFRDGYKWCAGLYFASRFIIVVIKLACPCGVLQVSLLSSVCCVVLAVFVLCQPYADNGDAVLSYRILNFSDTILLCSLCLISNFAGAASGIYADPYYKAFKVIVFILSYIPLVFLFGLLVYFLRYKYVNYNRLVEIVDE